MINIVLLFLNFLCVHQERMRKLFIGRASYSLRVQMGIERILTPILNDPSKTRIQRLQFEGNFRHLFADSANGFNRRFLRCGKPANWYELYVK